MAHILRRRNERERLAGAETKRPEPPTIRVAQPNPGKHPYTPGLIRENSPDVLGRQALAFTNNIELIAAHPAQPSARSDPDVTVVCGRDAVHRIVGQSFPCG